MSGLTGKQIRRIKSSIKSEFDYEVIAGTRNRELGLIGIYHSKREAISHQPNPKVMSSFVRTVTRIKIPGR